MNQIWIGMTKYQEILDYAKNKTHDSDFIQECFFESGKVKNLSFEHEIPLSSWRGVTYMLKNRIEDDLLHRLKYGPEYIDFEMTPKGPVQNDIKKPPRKTEIQMLFGYGLIEVYDRTETNEIVNVFEKIDDISVTDLSNKDIYGINADKLSNDVVINYINQYRKTAKWLASRIRDQFINSEFTHLIVLHEV